MIPESAEAEDAAIEALQSLGCREYEAKCYVALTRLSTGTAKDVSKITDIPRTRVYDAMEDLLEKGLVEVHYSTPKRYRAVPVTDAVAWFRHRYEQDLQRFEESAEILSPVEPDAVEDPAGVWAIVGLEAILIRVNNLVQAADREVFVYLTEGDRFDRELLRLIDSIRPPNVYVAVPTDGDREFVTETFDRHEPTVLEVDVPLASVQPSSEPTNPLTIVVRDGESMLVRTVAPTVESHGGTEERAIVAEGRYNALVLWTRTLFGL